MPEVPEDPLDPEEPEVPLDPRVPEDPDVPEEPDDPLDPEVPEEPLDPEVPDDAGCAAPSQIKPKTSWQVDQLELPPEVLIRSLLTPLYETLMVNLVLE